MARALDRCSDLFDAGPPLRTERRLGLLTADRPRVMQRAALAVLIGWVPLAVLAAAETLLRGNDGARSLLADFAVWGRSLIAAPLLIVAESDAIPRLGRVARHFLEAGFVTERDRPPFEAAIASTRRWLDSTAGELIAVVFAYGIAVTLILSVPHKGLPAWHLASGSSLAFSPAGWWHVLVSIPLLLVLVFGWLWRVLLWARFLWLMARLRLRLIPGHPDRAGGLQFVSTSLRGFRLPSFALGAIVAGMIANQAVHHGASPLDYKNVAAAVPVAALVLFAGPLLVFARQLRDAKWWGMFEYGALAGVVGKAFEQKWLAHTHDVGERALKAEDFSATNDLYSVTANVYEMKDIPFDVRELALLAGSALMPMLPLTFLAVPIEDVLKMLTKLLF